VTAASQLIRNEAEQRARSYLHLAVRSYVERLSRRRHVDDVVDGTHPGLMSWAARSSPYLWARRAQEPVLVRSSASLARSVELCRSELAEAVQRKALEAVPEEGGDRGAARFGTNVSISIEPAREIPAALATATKLTGSPSGRSSQRIDRLATRLLVAPMCRCDHGFDRSLSSSSSFAARDSRSDDASRCRARCVVVARR